MRKEGYGYAKIAEELDKTFAEVKNECIQREYQFTDSKGEHFIMIMHFHGETSKKEAHIKLLSFIATLVAMGFDRVILAFVFLESFSSQN